MSHAADRKSKFAELALILAIPKMCSAPPGRIRGLCDRIEKAALAEIERLPKLATEQMLEVGQKLDEFRAQSGKWQTRGAHVCTYVSFLLDLIDARPWSKIKEILVEIVDYFDRAGKMPTPSAWAGELACDKFRKIING